MTGTFTPGSKLFIDSGAFIALSHEDDNLHGEAVAFYKTVPVYVLRMTTLAVIGETYTFLRYHVGQGAAVAWLDFVEKALVGGHLRVTYPDADVDRAAREVLRRFTDQELSYADALTLAVIETERVKFVFGFDHHMGLTGRVVLPGALRR